MKILATLKSFGLKTEHVLAKIASGIAKVVPAIQKEEPVIEGIEAAIYPPAVVVTKAAFVALGYLAKAANDGTAAANQKLQDLGLDTQEIADFKSLYASLHAVGASAGITLPAPTPVPVPA